MVDYRRKRLVKLGSYATWWKPAKCKVSGCTFNVICEWSNECSSIFAMIEVVRQNSRRWPWVQSQQRGNNPLCPGVILAIVRDRCPESDQFLLKENSVMSHRLGDAVFGASIRVPSALDWLTPRPHFWIRACTFWC